MVGKDAEVAAKLKKKLRQLQKKEEQTRRQLHAALSTFVEFEKEQLAWWKKKLKPILMKVKTKVKRKLK